MFDVVLLMAGSGLRSGLSYNKMFYEINGRPLFLYSLQVFLGFSECSKIVLVIQKEEEQAVRLALADLDQAKIQIVYGGPKRQDSVARGVLATLEEVVLIHDGARPCIRREDVEKLLSAISDHPAGALATYVTDTIRKIQPSGYTVLDRSELMAMQTPQALRRSDYLRALAMAEKMGFYGTDDLQLVERFLDIKPVLVLGDASNIKVTTSSDLQRVKTYFQGGNMNFKIGHAHDTHRLVANRPLVLAGVTIPYEKGLLGHSDADVVYHVVSEAIIGALGLGDLGRHFSDQDPKYHNIASDYFVKAAKQWLDERNYQISNLDLTIFIEEPHLQMYKEQMKNNIASLLKINSDLVNVKATRGEGLGFIGQKEGISAECVVLIYQAS